MPSADFAADVLRFLAEDLNRTVSSVDPETTDLIGEEVLDSMGIFALIGFIEDRYDVEIDPEDITVDNFRSLVMLERLVESKRNR